METFFQTAINRGFLVIQFNVLAAVNPIIVLCCPIHNPKFFLREELCAGGYAAGYYSYKWAEVLSADAFSAFEEVGLENEEAVKKTGKRFRETVLGLGGGRPPAKVFKDFRGREPSTDALLRHSGLLTAAA